MDQFDELAARTRCPREDSLEDRRRHTELAEQILEESGYTEMWKNDKSAEALGGSKTSRN
jgi:superfamily I DNA/RNA helicase